MVDAHLSIGEVLTLLQDEFPDITISKIRFLESQGLISPERTPSGYRKFYGPDIDRLRWILLQQRENFLPLKVIKERLETEGPDMGEPVSALPESNSDEPGDAADPPVDGSDTSRSEEASEPVAASVRSSMTAGELDPPEPDPTEAPLTEGEGSEASANQPIWMADIAASRSGRNVRAAVALPLHDAAALDEVRLTAAELLEAAGIDEAALADLEKFGLLSGRTLGDDLYYDADALVIAKRSAAFFARGVGARHLRMFKVAAEREAGFLEQMVMPMLKKRNPGARQEAVELLEELSDLGHDLRAALLRANLREHLHRS